MFKGHSEIQLYIIVSNWDVQKELVLDILMKCMKKIISSVETSSRQFLKRRRKKKQIQNNTRLEPQH